LCGRRQPNVFGSYRRCSWSFIIFCRLSLDRVASESKVERKGTREIKSRKTQILIGPPVLIIERITCRIFLRRRRRRHHQMWLRLEQTIVLAADISLNVDDFVQLHWTLPKRLFPSSLLSSTVASTTVYISLSLACAPGIFILSISPAANGPLF
jgi:hypothetical protein